jgi:hypothetical protein
MDVFSDTIYLINNMITFISLNTNGLHNTSKRISICKEIQGDSKDKIVFLQETHSSNDYAKIFQNDFHKYIL